MDSKSILKQTEVVRAILRNGEETTRIKLPGFTGVALSEDDISTLHAALDVIGKSISPATALIARDTPLDAFEKAASRSIGAKTWSTAEEVEAERVKVRLERDKLKYAISQAEPSELPSLKSDAAKVQKTLSDLTRAFRALKS
jgi:hypothetical protein